MAFTKMNSTFANRIWRKDHFAGMLVLVIGAIAAYISSNYGIGSLDNIGPGFFPSAVSWILIGLGAAISLTAGKTSDDDTRRPMLPDIRGGICILAGLIVFVLLGEHGGLLPATFALVFISSMGDRENSILQSVFLAVCMCVMAVVIFWWALKMQFPLFSWSWS